MPDRRGSNWFVRQVSLGNVLTLVGMLALASLSLVTMGAWKGGMDADMTNVKLMIHDINDNVKNVDSKVDRISDTVASLDGKVSTLSPARKADAVVLPNMSVIPVGSSGP